MAILGIDSSDDFLSVGLAEGKEIILSRSTEPRARNKNMLHSFLTTILVEAGYSIGDLDGVAVAIGPGSFTGLRVGLAVTKGICWATRLPLVGVSSLAAIAHCAAAGISALMVIKDARRDEFYYAGFAREGGLIRQTIPDSVGDAREVAGVAAGYTLIGPGLQSLAKHSDVDSVGADGGYDRDKVGGAVAALGSEELAGGKLLDLATAIPNYIRVPKPREWKP